MPEVKDKEAFINGGPYGSFLVLTLSLVAFVLRHGSDVIGAALGFVQYMCITQVNVATLL